MKGNGSISSSNYQILQDAVLGEGTFGIVRLAVNQKNNDRVAIKFIPRAVSNDAVEKEYLLHKAASAHPNIIKMIGRYEDNSGYYFVMEYAAGGELFERIEPEIGFGSQDLTHLYFCQLVDALESIHAKGIVHRDLKPENVLLDENGILKLTDFGVSTLFMFRGERRKIKVKCGSELYMAPQVYNNTTPYEGEMADIWSLGVMLFVMLFGKIPWDRPDEESCEEYACFCRDGIPYLQVCNGRSLYQIDEQVFDLLGGMLRIDENSRLSLQQIKQHSWYNRNNILRNSENGQINQKMLMEMLTKGPHVCILQNQIVPTCNSIAPKQPEFLPLSQPDHFLSPFSQCKYSPSKIASISHAQLQNAIFSQPVQHNAGGIGGSFYSQVQSQDIACPIALEHAALGLIDTNALRLTRFYSPLSISQIIDQISQILDAFLVQFQITNSLKVQFKTVDIRKCILTGEVVISPFGNDKRVIIFKKNRGDSIEFKRLFYAIYEAFQTAMI